MTAENPPRDLRRILLSAAALALGLAIALATAELALRITGIERQRLHLTMWVRYGPSLRYDEARGWVNLPGTMGTNHQGFRFPRDYTYDSGRRRIAIIGDSQVFGLGVADHEHLGALLDQRLADFEVYPFGVPGYGPTQELLLLEEVLQTYPVDAVVAVPFLENDLIDATLMMAYGHLQKPYLENSDGSWRVANSPVPLPLLPSAKHSGTGHFFSRGASARFLEPRWNLFAVSAICRTLVRRSVSAPWLAQGISALGLAELSTLEATVADLWSLRRVDGEPVACSLVSRCPEAHWLDGLDATLAAYRMMSALCEERGVPFVAVVTPSATELKLGRFPITSRIVAGLREQGTSVLDLTRVFRAGPLHALLEPPPHLHWTALGHRRVAEALEGHVAAAGW